MNITQILLGFTAALLLAAIVFSYSDMQNGVAEDGRIQTASQKLDENNRLQAEIDRLRGGALPPVQAVVVEKPTEMSSTALAEIEQQNELLKQQLVSEEEKRIQAEAESLALTERQSGRMDKDARRANLISIAMLMAQVSEVAEQDGIMVIVLNVIMQQQVNVNTELAIRRGNGIVGRLVVSNIVDGNVFADPLPGTFPGGDIDVKVGDELILAPDY